MNDEEIEDLVAAAVKPVRRPVLWLTLAVVGLGGGGGTWAHHTSAHEQLQDAHIARNGTTIRQIAALLVQQGRHVEGMVRAVSEGKPIPGRPPSLNEIEAQILATPIN